MSKFTPQQYREWAVKIGYPPVLSDMLIAAAADAERYAALLEACEPLTERLARYDKIGADMDADTVKVLVPLADLRRLRDEWSKT